MILIQSSNTIPSVAKRRTLKSVEKGTLNSVKSRCQTHHPNRNQYTVATPNKEAIKVRDVSERKLYIPSQNNGKNIFTFDGCSCVYGSDGWLLTDAPMYAEATLCAGWDSKAKAIDTSGITSDPRSEIDEVYHSLRYGCQRFLEQAGIGKMTIGLSGGIDSAVTAALFVDILGPDNVLLVNMPSRYNSPMTQTIAEQTAQSLGANYTVIPITESCLHTSEQLTQTPIHSYHQHRDFQLTISPLIYENIQSRDRGSRVVAGLAAAFGGAFSCNSNKTELTVGYATFYGDICGALAPIGDLWKHHVYELGRYLNDKVFQRQVLPEAIFTIRPSAELSSEQTVGTGGLSLSR